MSDIWKDPRVVEALKERSADEIAVLDCPQCGALGYYNEGSHFTCLFCDTIFYVLGEDEPPRPGVKCVRAEDMIRLSDTVDAEGLP